MHYIIVCYICDDTIHVRRYTCMYMCVLYMYITCRVSLFVYTSVNYWNVNILVCYSILIALLYEVCVCVCVCDDDNGFTAPLMEIGISSAT